MFLPDHPHVWKGIKWQANTWLKGCSLNPGGILKCSLWRLRGHRSISTHSLMKQKKRGRLFFFSTIKCFLSVCDSASVHIHTQHLSQGLKYAEKSVCMYVCVYVCVCFLLLHQSPDVLGILPARRLNEPVLILQTLIYSFLLSVGFSGGVETSTCVVRCVI